MTIFRACGCRDENGRRYGVLPDRATATQQANACPRLRTDRKHGTYGFVVSRGSGDARQLVRKRGLATKAEARQEEARVLEELDQGTYVKPQRVTVEAWCREWLPRRAATGRGLKETTRHTYEAYIDNDIANTELGRMRIDDVRRYHVQAYVDGLVAAGRGTPTVKHIVAVLASAFRDAVRAQRMRTNPAHDLDLPRGERKQITAWEPAQVGAFLDEAAKDRLGVIFEVAAFTGLRRGELCGLRWEHVDLEAGRLRVGPTRTLAGRVIESETAKNAASETYVDLADRTVGALLAWKLQQEGEADAWGDAWQDTGYVFTREDGTPVRPDYVSKLFQRVRKAARLPKLTLHGLRHEHATLLIEAGVPIEVVSKRLRHSSIKTTADIYAHVLKSTSKAAAEAAASMVPTPNVQPVCNQQPETGNEKAPSTLPGAADPCYPADLFEPPARIELATPSLRVKCSTD